MIPAAFDYRSATSLTEALELLQRDPDGAKLVAGGHTLIPALKLRLASPTLLVDGVDPFAGGECSVACRLYRDESGRAVAVPSVAQLRAVLEPSSPPTSPPASRSP